MIDKLNKERLELQEDFIELGHVIRELFWEDIFDKSFQKQYFSDILKRMKINFEKYIESRDKE